MEDSKLPIKVKKLSELEYLNIFNIPENKHGVTVKRTMLVDPYLGRSTLNRISLDFSTGVIESNLLDSPLNKGFLNVDEYGCSVRDMAHPRLKHHKIYSIDDCEPFNASLYSPNVFNELATKSGTYYFNNENLFLDQNGNLILDQRNDADRLNYLFESFSCNLKLDMPLNCVAVNNNRVFSSTKIFTDPLLYANMYNIPYERLINKIYDYTIFIHNVLNTIYPLSIVMIGDTSYGINIKEFNPNIPNIPDFNNRIHHISTIFLKTIKDHFSYTFSNNGLPLSNYHIKLSITPITSVINICFHHAQPNHLLINIPSLFNPYVDDIINLLS